MLKKNNIKLNKFYAWFDGNKYSKRIDILNHCIDTINKNIEREHLKKRVVFSTGGTTLKQIKSNNNKFNSL